MFELIDSGGTDVVLVASASIDVSDAPFVRQNLFSPEFELEDGSVVYAPSPFRSMEKPNPQDDSAVAVAHGLLGHPGYVFAVIDPDDLRGMTNPTVGFLMQAADYGARLFLSTPRYLRIPRPLRYISTMTFQNLNPDVHDAATRGLITLSGACVPNYRLKELVEIFDYDVCLASGYAENTNPEVAIADAMQQVANIEGTKRHMLIIRSPLWTGPWDFPGVLDRELEGPCIYSYDGEMERTEANYYRELA